MIRVAVMLFLGVTLLVGSIVKVSRDEIRRDNTGESLRVVPITFNIEQIDGSEILGEYKIPAAGMLPNNPWYGLKIIRNLMWERMSDGETEKTKIKLLIADKTLSEGIVLWKNGQERKGWETIREASEMLFGAVSQFKTIELEEEERLQLRFGLTEALGAYKEVIGSCRGSMEIEEEEIEKLINELEWWNEKV